MAEIDLNELAALAVALDARDISWLCDPRPVDTLQAAMRRQEMENNIREACGALDDWPAHRNILRHRTSQAADANDFWAIINVGQVSERLYPLLSEQARTNVTSYIASGMSGAVRRKDPLGLLSASGVDYPMWPPIRRILTNMQRSIAPFCADGKSFMVNPEASVHVRYNWGLRRYSEGDVFPGKLGAGLDSYDIDAFFGRHAEVQRPRPGEEYRHSSGRSAIYRRDDERDPHYALMACLIVSDFVGRTVTALINEAPQLPERGYDIDELGHDSPRLRAIAHLALADIWAAHATIILRKWLRLSGYRKEHLVI